MEGRNWVLGAVLVASLTFNVASLRQTPNAVESVYGSKVYLNAMSKADWDRQAAGEDGYEQGYAEGYERGFQNAAEIGYRTEGEAYRKGLQSVVTLEIPCYEDEVILWNGKTNQHDTCWALDDIGEWTS